MSMEIEGEALNLFNQILGDYTPSDREFLKRNIEEKLSTVDISGLPLIRFIPASIYLITKCPTYSDIPVPLGKIIWEVDSYIKKNPYANHTLGNWRKQITYLARQNLFKDCPVTPETIIEGSTSRLFKDCCEFSDQVYSDETLSKFKQLSSKLYTDWVKLNTMGRNPYCVVAGIYYIASRLMGLNFTQRNFSYFFKISDPALRQNYKDIFDLVEIIIPA